MKITYDPEADALYIELRDVRAHDSVDVEEGVTADLDEKGHIIGLEVLDATERLSPDELTSVHYENLLLSEPAVKPRPRRRRPAAARR